MGKKWNSRSGIHENFQPPLAFFAAHGFNAWKFTGNALPNKLGKFPRCSGPIWNVIDASIVIENDRPNLAGDGDTII